ncbi:MAG: hypothetical protein D6797_02060 [Bdellovibrio sp.]|nr:MAG: hypothetical protein D6797_02060 [Bdellovibrio sp.]
MIKKQESKVISQDEDGKIIFEYHPREFHLSSETDEKRLFDIQELSEKSDFQMDPLVAEQVGLSELNRKKITEKVEKEALERLKEVEEKAYQEGYNLGLEEGKKEAFEKHKAEIQQRIEFIDQILKKFDILKEELVNNNEAEIIQLVHELACQISYSEISEKPEIILNVIKSVLKETQGEEEIRIYLSPQDYSFLKESRKKLGKELADLERVGFEESENIEPGGCVLESKYGSVDASLRQRVEQAWIALKARIPHVKVQKSETTGGDDSGHKED